MQRRIFGKAARDAKTNGVPNAPPNRSSPPPDECRAVRQRVWPARIALVVGGCDRFGVAHPNYGIAMTKGQRVAVTIAMNQRGPVSEPGTVIATHQYADRAPRYDVRCDSGTVVHACSAMSLVPLLEGA